MKNKSIASVNTVNTALGRKFAKVTANAAELPQYYRYVLSEVADFSQDIA